MPRFRVFLRGENLVIRLEDEPTEVGFYTTRAISAPTAEMAVWTAEERVRSDLRQQQGTVTDRLSIHLEEVHRVSWWWKRLLPASGFTFYLHGGDDEGDDAGKDDD